MTTTIALVQLASPPTEPVAERVERVAGLVADAAARGADVVVLPELWASGYFDFDRYRMLAEPIDGPLVSTMAGWARDHAVRLLGGSVLERDGQRIHNTAVLFDRDGALLRSYRKVHTFGHGSQEARLITPGDDVAVVATAYGDVGLALCYDLRFPELFRIGADAGATTYLMPAAWPQARIEHWRLLTSARALESQLVLVACNAAGRQGADGEVVLGGRSRVVGPDGALLAEAGTDETTLFCEVDLDCVEQERHRFSAFHDRRLLRGGTARNRPEGVLDDVVGG